MNKLDQLVNKSIVIHGTSLFSSLRMKNSILCGKLLLKVRETSYNELTAPCVEVYANQFGFPTYLGNIADSSLYWMIIDELRDLTIVHRQEGQTKKETDQQALIDSLLEELSTPQNSPPQNYPPMPV